MTTARELYCLSCKRHTATNNREAIVMKNGRDAVQGRCAECDRKKVRIGKDD